MRFMVQVYSPAQLAVAKTDLDLLPGDELQVNTGNGETPLDLPAASDMVSQLRDAFPQTSITVMTAGLAKYAELCWQLPEGATSAMCNFEPEWASLEWDWRFSGMNLIVRAVESIAKTGQRAPSLMVSGRPFFDPNHAFGGGDPWDLALLCGDFRAVNVQLQHLAHEGQIPFLRGARHIWESADARECVWIQLSVDNDSSSANVNGVPVDQAIAILRDLDAKMPDAKINLFSPHDGLDQAIAVIEGVRG